MNRKPDKDKRESPYAQVGLAMSIPMMLLAGPLVGYGLGWLIQRWTGWGTWIIWVMVVLGVIAGIREVIQVIQRLG